MQKHKDFHELFKKILESVPNFDQRLEPSVELVCFEKGWIIYIRYRSFGSRGDKQVKTFTIYEFTKNKVERAGNIVNALIAADVDKLKALQIRYWYG